MIRKPPITYFFLAAAPFIYTCGLYCCGFFWARRPACPDLTCAAGQQLEPVRGLTPKHTNMRVFCRQDYPNYELILRRRPQDRRCRFAKIDA